MSKHRRRTAHSRLDQPTQVVLGVAITEHGAALVVIRHSDEVTVVRDAMSCSDWAHLLAVLAAVLAQLRSALERGYDITAIAFTWTPNVDNRARQLAEWLTTLTGPDVVMVECSAAAGGVPEAIVPAAGLGTSAVFRPREADLALARRAAQAAVRSSAPQREPPQRGRTLVRAAAITASLTGVLGILAASQLRVFIVSTPAPPEPPAVPVTDGDPSTSSPDTSSSAGQPPPPLPPRAAGAGPSAIDMAQSTQAHHLRAPESGAGPSTAGALTLPPVTSPPLPPRAATQPVIGLPDVPDTGNTDAPLPPPADASASQAAPLPAPQQPGPPDAPPPPLPPDNPAPPGTQ